MGRESSAGTGGPENAGSRRWRVSLGDAVLVLVVVAAIVVPLERIWADMQPATAERLKALSCSERELLGEMRSDIFRHGGAPTVGDVNMAVELAKSAREQEEGDSDR